MHTQSAFRVRLLSTAALLALAAVADIRTVRAADTAAPVLDEIVVTAQKREERIQQVPITIAAFKGEELKAMAVETTADLPIAVPGFQISGSASNQLYYLRGVGSQQVGPGVASEVATFVDGVYMPAQFSNLQGFSSVQSIEVDKGPQGTLFGRNATGGVIQITTRDPQHEFTADGELSYASYTTLGLEAYVTGGITENLAADLSIYVHDQRDGYGTNLANGHKAIYNSFFSERSKWVLNVSDSTSVRLIVDHSETYGDTGDIIRPAKGVPYLINLVTNSPQYFPGFYDINADTGTLHRTSDTGVSIKVQSDFDWAQFSSISAWRQNKTNLAVDYDGGPQTLVPIANKLKNNVFTQELQLSSAQSSLITWTAGAFFLRDRGHTKPFVFYPPFSTIGFGAPAGTNYELYSDTGTTSFAGYAQGTATIWTDTHLTLGARYTSDKKTLDGYILSGGVVVPSSVGHQKVTYGKPTLRASIDHDVTPDAKVFFSYNRGYQAGNFNANNAGGYSPAANPPLGPETLDAFETGVKSEWFNHTLRVNVSGFHYNYRNLQQQIYDNTVLVTRNAGKATINGIDAEVRIKPTAAFDLGVSGELLKAKFDDYAGAPIYFYAPGGFLLSNPGNAAGKYLPFAPKRSATAFANYTVDSPAGAFTTSVTLVYSHGYYADPSNIYKEPAYALLNISENWMINDALSLMLWGKNLTNTKYDQSVASISPQGFDGNIPGAPRVVGVTLHYHW